MYIFKFSEVWMALFALVGTILDKLGVISPDAWNAIIVPSLLYIVGRVVGNVAKGNYVRPTGATRRDEPTATSGKISLQ